jgi:PAS domain S-box-containing protein
MSDHKEDRRTRARLLAENEELRLRLKEAEQTPEAMRRGAVDVPVVSAPPDEQIHTLSSAEHIGRVVVETMNEAVLMVDPDGTVLFSNQRFCDLMKTTIEGVVGHKMTAFVARPWQAPLKAFLGDAQAGPLQRHLTLRATDGTAVPVQLSASPIQAGANKSICLVATDLTALENSSNSIRILREHEQALEESEGRFRTIFEASQDAVVITDNEGVYVQANPAVQEVFGLAPQELVGRRMPDFLREDVDFQRIWQTLLTTGRFRGEMCLIRPDGQGRHVEAYGVAGILPGRHLWVIRDITERKHAEEALLDANERLQNQTEELETQSEELRVQTEELRVTNDELAGREEELRAQTEELRAANAALASSGERLRLAQRTGRVGVFDRDLRNNTVVWTPELEELFGIPVGGFGGKSEDWIKRVHSEDRARMVSMLQEWIRSNRSEKAWQYRIIRDDGAVRWMEGRGRILRDPNGKALRMIGTNMDITERKQAEEALRRSEERYRRLFDEDLTGDFIATSDGRVIECNPAFAKIYGFADRTQAARCDISQFNPADWSDLMARLRAECKVEGHQCVHRRPDGREIHVVANVVGRFDEAAELTEVQGYIYDDTERKHTEEELRSAALFPEQNPSPVLRVARDGTLLYANGASAFLLRSWNCRPGQAVPEEIRRHIAQAADSGKTAEVDVVCGPVTYSFSIAPIASEGYANLYGRDITKRKEAEEALRKSEEKFAKTFRSSPIAVAVTRASDGHIIEVNEALLKLLRFPREEVIGRTTLDLGIWVDLHERSQLVQELSAAGSVRDRECRLRTRDGGIVTIHLSAELLEFEGERCMLATLVDVTERRQAEEALRESEERLKRAQEIAHLGSWELDLVNDRLSWSDEVYRIFGLEPQEFDATYEAFLEGVHPDDRAAVDAAYSGSLREGRDTYEIEHRIVRKSTGEVRVVHEKCEHFRDTSGRIIRSIGMVHDVTERKQAEDALRETRDYLDNLFRYANAPIIVWDPQFTITRFNHAFERLTGRQAKEVLGRDIGILFPADSRAESLAHIRRTVSEGQRWEVLEIPILHRDGSVRMVLWNSANVLGPDDKTIIATIAQGQDITERKQAEEALRELNATLETKVAERTAQLEHRARQLQRLTLELSEAEDRERRHLAEILHDDLQQQLAAAKFHLSLLSNRARSDPPQQTMIGQVDRMLMDAIQKSRSLSHELSPAVLYQSGLADALAWLAEQIKTKHGLEVAVAAFGTISVESDALKTFLYRAAQELLFNVVKHARVNQARIRVRSLGRCIGLSVTDRGRGFDPQGLRETAGFGLLSIRERVELLGGRMKIRSAPGHGATLHIVVPDGQQKLVHRWEETAGVSLESPMVSPAAPVRGGTIPHEERRLRVLLADDHEIVREGLASLLQEEAGIQVVGQAANGREAVDLAARLQPDVVVMDVAMPLINGDEATRQIMAHLPGTRIVALSMYEEADLVERMQRAGAESYVLKTAPAEELLAAIRGHPPAHAP